MYLRDEHSPGEKRWPNALHADLSHTWLSWEWFSLCVCVRLAQYTVLLPALQADQYPQKWGQSELVKSCYKKDSIFGLLHFFPTDVCKQDKDQMELVLGAQAMNK